MGRNEDSITKLLVLLGFLFALSIFINRDLVISDSYQHPIIIDGRNLKTSTISSPISIFGNSGWANAKTSGICTGFGTYSEPYVIEDLIIDAGGTANCILIQNSNVYFRIENCTLFDSAGSPAHSGIVLKYTGNGTIIRNNCSYNNVGITFDPDCENNTIQANIISNNNEYGLNIMDSSNNYVKDNNINNNGNMGINLDPNSPYNEIINNTVNFNGWLGIHMQDNSSNNLILSNNCSFNNEGISVRTPNNTISGNVILNNSGYGIHLWNADSIHNTFSNNITKNLIQYNNYGVILDADSKVNVIEGNLLLDNTGTGVWLSALTSDNLVYNNTFINNQYSNANDDGINNNWNSSSLGNYWDDYNGVDANDDGIGDTPYDIPGSSFGAADNFPIWNDGPELGISGYNLFFLVGAFLAVGIVIVILKSKNSKK